MKTPISSFDGAFEFLSNFAASPIRFGAAVYPTAEHAYQAARTVRPEDHEAVLRAETPNAARRLGRSLPNRKDWDEIRIAVMKLVVRAKFLQNPPLQEALSRTAPAILVEGNTWGDQFWGVCEGKGLNHLGELLMTVRGEIEARVQYQAMELAPLPVEVERIAAATRVVRFAELAERLKTVLRHSWLSDGRRESVAEHTWMMAMLAVVVGPLLEKPADLQDALRMVLVHDLPEALTGDTPAFDRSVGKEEKRTREQAAIHEIARQLPDGSGDAVVRSWMDFEHGSSAAARLVRALDHLEVQMQHNCGPFETWTADDIRLIHNKSEPHCTHDSFLRALSDVVTIEASLKLRRADGRWTYMDMAAGTVERA